MKEQNKKALESEGFEMFQVKVDKNSECPYVLINANGEPLDPINFKEFVEDEPETIWIKYTPLRRANRCIEARPIEILEYRKL